MSMLQSVHEIKIKYNKNNKLIRMTHLGLFYSAYYAKRNKLKYKDIKITKINNILK